MKSRTKFPVDCDTVARLFGKTGLGEVTACVPLGAGEYNTVLAVTVSDGKEYALKVAPSPEAEILTYEKDMMRSELYWYGRMSKDTSIGIPKIYCEDFTRTLLPVDWFVMEKLKGTHPPLADRDKARQTEFNAAVARQVAQLHRVKNDKFGYIQNGLHGSWYEAIRSMVVNLITDCEAKGRRTGRGEILLRYIDLYKDVLAAVDCNMVNYDIWATNIITSPDDSGGTEYKWIDPERSFWGDRMADFVCLEMSKPLNEKKTSIEAYNAVAENPLACTREEEIRWGIMCAYMGLIQETEKYYRYSPFMAGWWRNVVTGGAVFYKFGFDALKKHE